jgi:hypothetical protein
VNPNLLCQAASQSSRQGATARSGAPILNPRAFRTLSTKRFHRGGGNRCPECPGERLAADGCLQAVGLELGLGTPAQPRAPAGKSPSDGELSVRRQNEPNKLRWRRLTATTHTCPNASLHRAIPHPSCPRRRVPRYEASPSAVPPSATPAGASAAATT